MAESLISWLGAVGVLVFLVFLWRRRTRSFLERRMLLLLGCLAALFLFRGFFWHYGGSEWRSLTFLPAAFLPLGAALFVEGLRRRHVDPALKTVLAAGTTVFVLLAPWTGGSWRELYFDGLTIYVLVTLAWLVLVLLWRKRADLAPSENRLADAVAAASAVAVLVALTDFRLRPDWLPVRLGGLGGLFFVWVSVRLTVARDLVGTLLRDLLTSLLLAAGLTVIIATLAEDWSRDLIVPAAALALGFVWLLSIVERLRTADQQADGTALEDCLAAAELGSAEDFDEALQCWAEKAGHLLLSADELDPDDATLILDDSNWDSPVVDLASARRRVDRAPDASPAEAWIALLETHGMSHGLVLGRRPPRVLLLNVPQVAPARAWLDDARLLQRFARLLENTCPTS